MSDTIHDPSVANEAAIHPPAALQTAPPAETQVSATTGQSWFGRHPRMSWTLAFLAVWAAIVVWRFEVIQSPPYYDFATGLFVEANFLVESNFDYSALVEEQRWLAGGAAVYVTSIWPTVVALLMKYAPSTEAMLIAYHLIYFACAAGIALLVYALLVEQTGRLGAILTSAALLTVPSFAVQIDMLGMDLPVTLLTLLCALLLVRRHYALAAVPALGAYLIKASGRAAAMGALVYLLVLLAMQLRKASPRVRRALTIGLGLNLAAIGLIFAIDQWLAELPTSAVEQWENVAQTVDEPDQIGMRFLRETIYWFPDQVALFGVALIGSLAMASGWLVRESRARQIGSGVARWWSVVSDGVERQRVALLSWIMVLGTLLAFSFIYCMPRYFSLPLPFLYVALGVLLFSIPRLKLHAMVLLAGLIVLNVANARGAFLPQAGFNSHGRTGALLERSREYLTDHDSNVEALRQLAEKYPDVPIVAGGPYVQCLALPRLGYVDRPLSGYSVNNFTSENFAPVEQLLEDTPREIIFVSVVNALTPAGVLPEPDPLRDEILYNDRQPTPLVIFRRTWPSFMASDQIRVNYLELLWPAQYQIERGNTHYLKGEFAEAEALYRQALETLPDNAEARYNLAQALVMQGQVEESIEHYRRALADGPERADMQARLGVALFSLREFNTARHHLTRALELDPQNADALKALSSMLSAQGDRAQAAALLERCLVNAPDDVAAWLLLADVRVAQRAVDEAEIALQRALELNPRLPSAQRSLAQLLGDRGENEEAIEWLRRALALEPDDSASRYSLGRLLLLTGNDAEAAEAFEAVLELNPDDERAHFGMAQVHEHRRQWADAAEHYRQALRVRPDWLDASNNLAWLLATCSEAAVRNGSDAVALATRACQATGYQDPRVLDTLAAAHAEAGEFDEAVETAQQAIDLAKGRELSALADEISLRLELYRAKQPYRASDKGADTAPDRASGEAADGVP